MRKIAIVGSGIAGLVAAHGLLKAGYAVTVYSDRTADEWLNASRPTGTAARFDLALSYERELGLNFWDDEAPGGEGVYLTFCPALHNPLITLLGRFQRPFQAVDVRLQSARWMVEFERRGGQIVIGRIAPEDLETLAASHDLVIVAAGRADLCQMFARDAERSGYDAPQRQLAMVIAAGGPATFANVPMLPVRFDLLGTDGEIFFVPYYHKDAGASWNILVEAKAGSRLDRFRDLKTGDGVLAAVKAAVSELFPWDEPFVRNMHLADPLGWLTGQVLRPFGVRAPCSHPARPSPHWAIRPSPTIPSPHKERTAASSRRAISSVVWSSAVATHSTDRGSTKHSRCSTRDTRSMPIGSAVCSSSRSPRPAANC
jgi:siroheme synthase (precorrin-2 oxidase/ferrochelatase)